MNFAYDKAMVERLNSSNKNKIRLLFFAKRLTESFLVFSLAVVALGFFLNVYLLPSISPIPLRCGGLLRCGGFIPSNFDIERNALISSMLISGITGSLIFTPLTLFFNYRLKRLQTTYIKQEFVEKKDLIKFQRTSNKTVLRPKFN